MLQAINTKLLIAILAALTVIGGILIRQHQQNAPIAAAAQRLNAEAEARHKEELRYLAEYDAAVKERNKRAAATPDHSKDVQKYIP